MSRSQRGFRNKSRSRTGEGLARTCSTLMSQSVCIFLALKYLDQSVFWSSTTSRVKLRSCLADRWALKASALSLASLALALTTCKLEMVKKKLC